MGQAWRLDLGAANSAACGRLLLRLAAGLAGRGLLAGDRLPVGWLARLPLAPARLPLAGARLPWAESRLPLTGARLPLTESRLPLTGARLPLASTVPLRGGWLRDD